jgi:putative DNA primase/helicase
MTLDEILSRLTNVKRSGAGHTARCPAHDDSTNSFSIAKSGDGKLLLKCHAGCTVESICAALSIDVKDLFPAPVPKLAKRTRAAVAAKPVTLAELAEAKRLPIEFLRECGVEDFPDGSGVAIGYFDEHGEQYSRMRKRTALRAKDGSTWLGEGALIPYGIWKLKERRKENG